MPERPIMGGQVQSNPVNALPAFDRNGQVQPGCAVILRCSVRRGRNYNGTGIIIVDDFIHRLVIHPLAKVKPGHAATAAAASATSKVSHSRRCRLQKSLIFCMKPSPALGCLQTVLLYMMIGESAILALLHFTFLIFPLAF